MALIRWSPLRDVMTLRDEMDRLLDEFFGRVTPVSDTYEGDWCPAMDIAETENEIVTTVELPGMNKEDIKVSVKDDVLTISGEKKQEKRESGENYHRVERSYGAFKRMITLPSSVDPEKVKATYKDGVLKVTLPKLESAKPKEIPVQVS